MVFGVVPSGGGNRRPRVGLSILLSSFTITYIKDREVLELVHD